MFAIYRHPIYYFSLSVGWWRGGRFCLAISEQRHPENRLLFRSKATQKDSIINKKGGKSFRGPQLFADFFQYPVTGGIARHGEHTTVPCHALVFLYYLLGNIQQSDIWFLLVFFLRVIIHRLPSKNVWRLSPFFVTKLYYSELHTDIQISANRRKRKTWQEISLFCTVMRW